MEGRSSLIKEMDDSVELKVVFLGDSGKKVKLNQIKRSRENINNK